MIFPGKDTGVGCHFLLQGIFPTQGLNPGFLHCRQILYGLSYKGSPYSFKYVFIAFFNVCSFLSEHLLYMGLLSVQLAIGLLCTRHSSRLCLIIFSDICMCVSEGYSHLHFHLTSVCSPSSALFSASLTPSLSGVPSHSPWDFLFCNCFLECIFHTFLNLSLPVPVLSL